MIVKLEERKKSIEDTIELQRHADDDPFDDTIGYEEVYSPTLPNPVIKHAEKEVVANGRLKNVEIQPADIREYFYVILILFLILQLKTQMKIQN